MIPGEIIPQDGIIEINTTRRTIELSVVNDSRLPIEVGSHYHFAEANRALQFDRKMARGFRLDIPAGWTMRFQPREKLQVKLVSIAGNREVYGFSGAVMGPI